jgi:hypothetical protein
MFYPSAVIGERESFETEECTDIENFLATLTKLLSLKPTFDEDINEEGRKGIEVVVDFVSGCVFKVSFTLMVHLMLKY